MKPATRSYSAGLLILLLSSLLVSGGCSQKQQKVYRVGILCGVAVFADTALGFKDKMRELGYQEGENIVYEMHTTTLDFAAEQRILNKFVADKVDLIVAFPTEASLAAKAAAKGTGIPLVFANANIESVDLVDSIRHPGGNLTGVRFPGPDIALKRFELLLELVPGARRIWITYLEEYPIVASQLDLLRPAAASLGITLVEVPATGVADIRRDLKRRSASGDTGMDAILMISEPLASNPEVFALLGEFAVRHKIPLAGSALSVKGYSSIFGVSTENISVGKQAASIAAKIFNGASAGSIPVVSAESYLSINYAASQRLGLKIQEGLLSQADKIIR